MPRVYGVQVRGAVLCVVGLLLLLLWDNPAGGHAIDHIEDTGIHQVVCERVV